MTVPQEAQDPIPTCALAQMLPARAADPTAAYMFAPAPGTVRWGGMRVPACPGLRSVADTSRPERARSSPSAAAPLTISDTRTRCWMLIFHPECEKRCLHRNKRCSRFRHLVDGRE